MLEKRPHGTWPTISAIVLGVVMASAILILALVHEVVPTNTSGADIDLGPTPSTLEELVSGYREPYDIVALAVVSDVVSVFPYETATPDPTEAVYADLLPEPPITLTIFSLDVERTFLDDGTISGGGPLLIIRRGSPEDAGVGWPMEGLGHRYLYFLEEVEGRPGVYLSDWSSRGRLIVEGDDVMISDFTPVPLGFATGTPPAQFMDALATEIAVQYATPTP